MKKMKWYSVLFALFVIFMYAMGIYDFFMMLGHNDTYYASHGYGESVVEYFTNYPIYFLVLWVLNLACGILSPILYLLKRKSCIKVAFISATADATLIGLTCRFRNRVGVLGWNIFAFDLFILIMTIGFGVLCAFTWKTAKHIIAPINKKNLKYKQS